MQGGQSSERNCAESVSFEMKHSLHSCARCFGHKLLRQVCTDSEKNRTVGTGGSSPVQVDETAVRKCKRAVCGKGRRKELVWIVTIAVSSHGESRGERRGRSERGGNGQPAPLSGAEERRKNINLMFFRLSSAKPVDVM